MRGVFHGNAVEVDSAILDEPSVIAIVSVPRRSVVAIISNPTLPRLWARLLYFRDGPVGDYEGEEHRWPSPAIPLA